MKCTFVQFSKVDLQAIRAHFQNIYTVQLGEFEEAITNFDDVILPNCKKGMSFFLQKKSKKTIMVPNCFLVDHLQPFLV